MHLTPSAPDLLPLLSRGKHRKPERGACFMELASVLAGERWSDHPACTHSLLAEVARNANDRIGDDGRQRLAPLIPSVIGVVTDDPRADARITLHCALTALPVAPQDAQRALVVGVLSCERQLDRLGDPAAELRQRARQVLGDVPDAGRWAARFASHTGPGRERSAARRFRRYAAPGIVTLAARSIEQSTCRDRDDVLVRMLEGAVQQCRTAMETEGAAAPALVPEPASVQTTAGRRLVW